ncbi:bifunctional tetrahydrofolate synthase/dihydrofolate synthase [Alteromonas flava]|uniref:bifunctional tetrahydrofolate synthase/dihydrofolate synthase n=1 Tax=Alteromonas flava TaxID=2048003 RepID=UPI000C283633|nr:bifunctional tetrahydrofolate synthase/dihydrofolate synthase [Alteromonas flava]
MKTTANDRVTAKTTWSLDQWLHYLLAIHPSEIDMGLDRVSRVYQRLGIQFKRTTVITVAGTNGKGSTCRFIELALQSLGRSVVVYSSPHISDYRERVRINNALPEAQAFCDAFLHIERMRGADSLTYFEFGTLAALLLAYQKAPDYLILEVGLGGRLDATNIVDADLAIVSSIDLDHQEYLGTTRESVAFEKAGIFRPDIPIVIGERDTPHTMLDQAHRLTQKFLRKGIDFDSKVNGEGDWDWSCGGQSVNGLPPPRLLRDNISTALAGLQALGLLESLITQPRLLHDLVATATLPGRMQVLQKAPLWIADVGHNPHAAKAIASELTPHLSGQLYIIVGMMKDKSIAETLQQLQPLSPKWLPATLPGERAASAETLAGLLNPADVVGHFDSVASAVSAVNAKVQPHDTVLVFGSFVTVDQLLTLNRRNTL